MERKEKKLRLRGAFFLFKGLFFSSKGLSLEHLRPLTLR